MFTELFCYPFRLHPANDVQRRCATLATDWCRYCTIVAIISNYALPHKENSLHLAEFRLDQIDCQFSSFWKYNIPNSMKTLRVIFTEAGYQPVLEQRLLGGVPRPVTLFLKLGSSLQARVLQSHWVFWRLTALNRRGLDLPKHTKSKQQLVLEIEPWLSGDDENPLTEDLCQQTRLRMMERYTYIIYI